MTKYTINMVIIIVLMQSISVPNVAYMPRL